jgi:hypothetical protein
MRKKVSKKLRKLAQSLTANSPDKTKTVYRRLKKSWNEAKPK